MKKIGEYMREMGFQKDSSEEAQKAFIKYLIRVAQKSHRPLLELDTDEPDHWSELKLHKNQQLIVDKALENSAGQQLSFTFEDDDKRKSG